MNELKNPAQASRPGRARVVEVIVVETRMGTGEDSDPVRTAMDFYTLDGKFIGQVDPVTRMVSSWMASLNKHVQAAEQG